MNIQIDYVEYFDKEDTFEISWFNENIEDHYDVFYVKKKDLLRHIRYYELNIIQPNHQSDDEPIVLEDEFALSEFQDDILKHYIINVVF